MHDPLQPILPMTRLVDLQLHIARTGLSIGDTAVLHPTADGRIGVFAPVQRYRLGLFPHRPLRLLGHLAQTDAALIAPALAAGQPFRTRIVGLTPEHLGPEPEVHISIWGNPRRLLIPPPLTVA